MGQFLLIFSFLFFIIFEVHSKSYCEFTGVEDNKTLSGISFIENAESYMCLSYNIFESETENDTELESTTENINRTGENFIKPYFCYKPPGLTYIYTSKKIQDISHYIFKIRSANANGGYFIQLSNFSDSDPEILETCLTTIHSNNPINGLRISSADCDPKVQSQIWNFDRVTNIDGLPRFRQNEDIYQIRNSATNSCLMVIDKRIEPSVCDSSNIFKIWRICTVFENEEIEPVNPDEILQQYVNNVNQQLANTALAPSISSTITRNPINNIGKRRG